MSDDADEAEHDRPLAQVTDQRGKGEERRREPEHAEHRERRPLELGRGHAPDEPVDDPEDLQQRAGAEEQRHHADDQSREPREPGEIGGAADGFGHEAPDAGLAREVAGVLVGGLGGEAEPDHRDEHVRHHEQEDPEGHRAREHHTAGGDVAVDGAEAGVDEWGVGARPLESVARVDDALREPRLLRLEAVGGAGDATGIGLVVARRRFPRGLHRVTVDQV